MNRLTFVVGLAVCFTAVFVGVAITFRGGPTMPAAVATIDVQTQASRGGRVNSLVPTEGRTGAPGAPRSLSGSGVPRKAVESATSVGGRVASRVSAASFNVVAPEASLEGLSPAERQNFLAAATNVEKQVREELRSLTAQFDLTPAQQQKIFPLLVNAAADFLPGMIAGGQTTAVSLPTDVGDGLESPDSVEDAIYNELEPDQQEAMVDVAIDNQAWWKEIVGQLEDDLNAALGGTVVDGVEAVGDIDSAAGDESSEVIERVEDAAPASREDGNLFDLLN